MNPIEFLQFDPGEIVFTLILMILLFFLFLSFGAFATGAPDIALSKILVAAIVITFAHWIVAAVLSLIPIVGGMLGFTFNFIAIVAIIKYVFMLQWKSAALLFTFSFLPAVTTGIILSLFFGIDLTSFAQRLFFVA